MPFKVIQSHRDFLLVINTNCYPASYRFEVITDYCSYFGHLVFLSPPPLGIFGKLGTTYTVHLRLIEKLVVDFKFFFARCYGCDFYQPILIGNQRF